MLIWLLAAMLGGTQLLAQKNAAPLNESADQGILKLLFITSFGDSVSGRPEVKVEDLDSGRTTPVHLEGQSLKLKYGKYRLNVRYPGAYPVERVVSIHDPFETVTICFFIVPVELPWDGNLIRGRISEKSLRNACLTVRLVSPFTDGESAETTVSADGHFAVENLRPGKYLALTLGGSGICEISEISLPFEYGKAVYDLSIRWTTLPSQEVKGEERKR